MREIKYRIWIPYLNRMMRPKPILEIQEETISGPTIGQMKQWVYLEYTGLKDKNGKEIYEGDILRYRYSTIEEPLITYKIGQVEYHDAAFVFGEVMDLLHLFYPSVEVIGNIYENPELINNEEVNTIR